MTKKKTPVKPTEKDDDEFVIAQYPDTFLTCRAVAHAWRIVTRASASTLTFEMHLECRNCKAHRHDTIHRLTGELMTRSYDYPNGYRHHVRTPKNEYRHEVAERFDKEMKR